MEIVELLTEILDKSRIRSAVSKERFKASSAGHELILDAIRKKDPDRANTAMSMHISNIENSAAPSFQSEES